MKPIWKQLSVASGALLSLALAPSYAFAQCAMCRASAAASGNASSLNLAILVLLIPPVIMFCAIFIVAYRLRTAQGDAPHEERKTGAASTDLYPPFKHSPFSK